MNTFLCIAIILLIIMIFVAKKIKNEKITNLIIDISFILIFVIIIIILCKMIIWSRYISLILFIIWCIGFIATLFIFRKR